MTNLITCLTRAQINRQSAPVLLLWVKVVSPPPSTAATFTLENCTQLSFGKSRVPFCVHFPKGPQFIDTYAEKFSPAFYGKVVFIYLPRIKMRPTSFPVHLKHHFPEQITKNVAWKRAIHIEI